MVPVVGVGSTASIQAHDNKVMYNGEWWPKEGQNTDHDDRFGFTSHTISFKDYGNEPYQAMPIRYYYCDETGCEFVVDDRERRV